MKQKELKGHGIYIKINFFIIAIFLSTSLNSQELITKENLEDHQDKWWYYILSKKDNMSKDYFLINEFLINGSKIEFEEKKIIVLDATYIMKDKNSYFILTSPSSKYDLESGEVSAEEGVLAVYDLKGEFDDFINKIEFQELIYIKKKERILGTEKKSKDI